MTTSKSLDTSSAKTAAAIAHPAGGSNGAEGPSPAFLEAAQLAARKAVADKAMLEAEALRARELEVARAQEAAKDAAERAAAKAAAAKAARVARAEQEAQARREMEMARARRAARDAASRARRKAAAELAQSQAAARNLANARRRERAKVRAPLAAAGPMAEKPRADTAPPAVQAGAAIALGMQKISGEWASWANAAARNHAGAVTALMQCRTPREVVVLNARLALDNMALFVETGDRVRQIAAGAALELVSR